MEKVTAPKLLGYQDMAKRFCSHKIECDNLIAKHPAPTCKNVALSDFPVEIIIHILRYLSHHELALSVRLVSLGFKDICKFILNTSFMKLERKILEDMERTRAMMKGSGVPSQLASAAYDKMEIIHAEYCMTKAVVWRYVFGSSTNLCMFAGRVMDAIEDIIRTNYDKRTNNQVERVHHLSKAFQDHFEDKIERKINTHWTISGAKLLDMLDCIVDPQEVGYKHVWNEDVNFHAGTYKLFCKYTIPRSWFTCLIPDRRRHYRKRHRLMAHCIRRLVMKHNIYSLKNFHEERQKLMFHQALGRAPACSYTGYHSGTLTYYGCLSPRAYRLRFFNPAFDNDDDDDDEEDGNDLEDDLGVVEEEEEGEEEEEPELFRLLPQPNMNLELSVKLSCRIEEAPLRIASDIRKKERYRVKRRKFNNYYFRIKVFCPSSRASRLPCVYKWQGF